MNCLPVKTEQMVWLRFSLLLLCMNVCMLFFLQLETCFTCCSYWFRVKKTLAFAIRTMRCAFEMECLQWTFFFSLSRQNQKCIFSSSPTCKCSKYPNEISILFHRPKILCMPLFSNIWSKNLWTEPKKEQINYWAIPKQIIVQGIFSINIVDAFFRYMGQTRIKKYYTENMRND